MMRSTVVLMAVLSISGVTRAHAQETTPGPGTFEITVIPAGLTYFASGNSRPSFGNYTLGGALTYVAVWLSLRGLSQTRLWGRVVKPLARFSPTT